MNGTWITGRAVAARALICLLVLSLYPAGGFGTATVRAADAAAAGDAAAAPGTVAVAPVEELQNGQRSDFIMGADVSELEDIRQSGKKFYDTDGTEMNAIQVLQKHGVNYIRLRNWVDPTDEFGLPIGGGNTGLASNIAIAKMAQSYGVRVLLDFHYSDFWADPGKQNKPKAWADHTGERLLADVADHTTSVLEAMKAEGVLPDMVQIGNEINGGLLWPDGRDADNAAPFLQAAARAVRAVDPAIGIMIHIAGNSSGSAGTFTWNLDKWTTGETAVDFDIIGISHYPYWHGTMAQNKAILDELASRYGKPVVVAETAYAWTLQPGDETINNFDRDSAYTAGYTPTPQGQAAMLRDMIDNLAGVPDGRGLGLFYWGADWLPGSDTGWIAGQGSGWENQALFDYGGKALPSADVFNLVRGTDAAPAAEFVEAEPAYAKVQAGSEVRLPDTVKGRFSDGRYRDVTVSEWDLSAVHAAEPGVYEAAGTIGGVPAAASAVVTVTPAQPANLVVNPGLEDGATGWTVTDWSAAGPMAGGSNPRSGASAVHYYKADAFADARVEQTLTVGDAVYTFSAWVMGDALASDKVPYLYASGFDAGDETVTRVVYAKPGGWANWLKYEMEVPVTSGRVTIGVNVNGAAGAWGDIDDFYFGEPPVASTLTQAAPVTALSGDRTLTDSALLTAGAEVTLTVPDGDADIYYTLDGSDPGYSSSSSTTLVYAGPIAVKANTVLKAVAVRPGYANSEIRTYRITADDAAAPGLVPDGGFERDGELGAWTIEGAAAGSGAPTTDAVHDAGDGTVYAGSGFFRYWSDSAYAFTLTQRITDLPNGYYTLTAQSAGESNKLINAAGRAENDPAVASLTLSAETPSGALTANVINQGQTPDVWHNIWRSYQVPGVKVTDGTATISFKADARANYWGYLDQVTLVRTGELPQDGTDPTDPSDPEGPDPTEPDRGSPGANVPAVPPATASVRNGTLTVTPTAGADGAATAVLKAEELQSAIGQLAAADGTGIVDVMVTPDARTREVHVDLPAAPLLSGGGAVAGIRIDTGFAAVTIGTAQLQESGAGAGAASTVRLSAAKVDASTLPAGVQAELNGGAVYEFSLTVDGKTITSFSGRGVTVAVDYALQAGETPGTVVAYYLADDGTLAIVKNGMYDPAAGRLVFQAKHFSAYAAAVRAVSFSDTTGIAWAADAIAALAARDAIHGVGGGRFAPDGAVTRAEFAAMLLGAFDLIEPGGRAGFSDVEPGAWYADAAASAQKLGIVRGKPDGSFGVQDPITRQDMAVMAYRAAQALQLRLGLDGDRGGDGNSDGDGGGAAFTDQAAIAPYAADAAAALRAGGILEGTGAGAFAPKATTTRAQAAVAIYRLFLKQTA